MTFEELQIDTRCLRVLQKKNITVPTPIQGLAIPPALEGRDVVAIAQTGTGKTLAFGLPALTRLSDAPEGDTLMLVLVPTRELAHQVHEVLKPLAQALKLTTACIYGGVGMNPQAEALRKGVDIVIATPGRLLDHIGRRNAYLDRVRTLVLDEADRMLDMGFLPDIRRIIALLPKERQTMMFSATFPADINRLAANMMRDPVRVEAAPPAKPAEAVRHGLYTVAREGKMQLLMRILRQEADGPTLVFTRTKRAADRVAKVLDREGFDVDAIHGDHSQGRRLAAIEGFRRGDHRILIATDIAARGIDINGISHVINYDIPATAEDYVHRIGRTARASASGDAITFVTPEDREILRAIERTIGKRLEPTEWEGSVAIPEPPPAAAYPRKVSSSRAFRSRTKSSVYRR